MVASEAKSVGDALVWTGGAATLSLGASNGEIMGVYHDADRAASATDTPFATVILTYPDLWWYAPVESGTAAATMVDDLVDLNSADGLDVAASTNDDFRITKFINTAEVVGFFSVTPYSRAT
jgi:hypothetical protein|tara:strand:- start:997 stop:1362 length:366 start_codon:yes stop_codon:yes gene_type:complete